MTRKRMRQLPQMPSWPPGLLAELDGWLARIGEEFERGRHSCDTAFASSGLESLRTNAAYYACAVSVVAALRAKVDVEIGRHRRHAQGDNGASGADAAGKV